MYLGNFRADSPKPLAFEILKVRNHLTLGENGCGDCLGRLFVLLRFGSHYDDLSPCLV